MLMKSCFEVRKVSKIKISQILKYEKRINSKKGRKMDRTGSEVKFIYFLATADFI